jgi:hypothetical protein
MFDNDNVVTDEVKLINRWKIKGHLNESIEFNKSLIMSTHQREIKKRDDISDTHKSTDQSRPTIVVGIKSSFYQILVYWLQFNFKLINILMKEINK